MSTLDYKLEPEVAEVRRLEVLTGTGRRRHFTDDFKARVVEETLVSGAVVSDVARRYGLTPAAGVHVAPPSARSSGDNREQDAAICAGHCRNGVAVTAEKCAARQADAPCAAVLCKHRG